MALPKFDRNVFRSAATGLAALAAVSSPMASAPAYADEARFENVAAVTSPSGWEQITAARDYSEETTGVGILIRKGADSGQHSVEQMGSILGQLLKEKGADASKAFGGMNETNPDATTFTFFIDGYPYGPYNGEQVFNEIPAVAARAKVSALLASNAPDNSPN